MATAGDGGNTYQSGGAGGKLRKRPIRRSAQATPYDRPPNALRNNSPSLFAKLVDPASRLIYAGADKLFGVFRKRLPSLPSQRQPGTNEEPRNGFQETVSNSASKNSIGVVEPSTNEGGHLASISVATEISDLENMLKQKTFTRSEIERLTALLHSKTTESNVVEGEKTKLPSTSYHVSGADAFTSGTLNKRVEEREIGNFDAAVLTPVVNSRAFDDDGATPAEIAKAYMGTRPTKLSPLTMRPISQTPRQDLVLLNNTITFPKTPTASHAPKTAVAIKTFENGLTPLRSRGRSALYNMPRTPYYRGPSTLSQKGVASPSPWEHEGSIGSSRMAVKRRSSAIEDIGSGGPIRRIRQKANLLSQQNSPSNYKSELGSSQKLLLRHEPEPKASVEETGEISKRNQNYGSVPTESSQMALKIFEQLERMSPKEKPSGSKLAGGTIEKIDSPKVLPSSQDNQKSEGKRVLFLDARESTFQSKGTVEENGSRSIAGHSNAQGSSGNFKVPVSGNALIETKAGSTTKRAFSMSAHEDSLELDDDNHSNGHASYLPGESKKAGASVLASNDISTNSSLPEVDPVQGIPEFKKGAIFSGSSIVNNQKTGFTFPASTSSSSGTQSSMLSQPTSVVDTVTPQNKPSVFPTFGTSTSNSAGPTGDVPNRDTDARILGPTSLSNSTMNNDQIQFSASNRDDNGNTQKPVNLFGNTGSSSSADLTTTSASPIFSFGGSTNNSGIINGTSASCPSSFASSSSFQPSGNSTDKIFSSSSSVALSSATTAFLSSTTTSAASSAFPTSVSASIFSSGSAPASSTPASMAPASPSASTLFATSSNGGSTFGISSSSAALTTNGFQAHTQITSTAVTQTVPFKFGSEASVMPSSTSSSSPFSSSVPSFGLTSAVPSSEIKAGGSNSSSATNLFGSGFSSAPSFGISSTGASSETKPGNSATKIFGTGSNSSPSFGLSSTVASSETKSGSSISSSATNMFGSGFSSTPSFGLGSTVATPETKSGSSASNIFGSTPFSFGASSTSMPSASSAPFMFGSSNAGASTGSSMFSFSSNSSFPAPGFGNSTPVFGTPPTNNNDHMSMEESMADDSNQTPSPSVPAFAQASSSTPSFMFGSATLAAPSPSPGFMFGGQTNQSQPQQPSQNPFPAPGNAQFNAGGSFSLGSGGDDKSNRRIFKVKRQNRRK